MGFADFFLFSEGVDHLNQQKKNQEIKSAEHLYEMGIISKTTLEQQKADLSKKYDNPLKRHF